MVNRRTRGIVFISLSLISILISLLGVLIAVNSFVRYIIEKIIEKRQHREKWADYYDCGLA